MSSKSNLVSYTTPDGQTIAVPRHFLERLEDFPTDPRLFKPGTEGFAMAGAQKIGKTKGAGGLLQRLLPGGKTGYHATGEMVNPWDVGEDMSNWYDPNVTMEYGRPGDITNDPRKAQWLEIERSDPTHQHFKKRKAYPWVKI